jgi:glycogen(starch) synthase
MSVGNHSAWHVWLVTDVYPPRCGGSGWSTHALARVLCDRGHRVRVFVIMSSHDDVVSRRYEDVEVTEIGVRRARRSPRARVGARDFAHRHVEAFLNERLLQEPQHVDVVHAQHLHSGPPAVAAGRRHGCATVVTVRDYWPVCLHGTSWWAGAGCAGCTPRNLRGCMEEYWGWPGPLTRAMVPWATRRLRARGDGLVMADTVVTVSQAVRRRIEGELPPADLVVVPNIVDPQELETCAAPDHASEKERFLLAAGKLQPTKGFDSLLAALSDAGRVPPLKVAGDGPSLAALRTQADAAGLDVEFLGWVDHGRLLALQRDAAAVLLPSAWEEPLSRVVLETMGLGTPVIAWARGGNPEIVESGKNSWLVSRPAEMSVALRELDQPGRRDEVGHAARRHVEDHYSPKAVYPRMASVYQEAIRKSRDRQHPRQP